jgi:predicted acyltransferase
MKLKPRTTPTDPADSKKADAKKDVAKKKKPPRLASLDAYRGFVMLAMASNGFAIAHVLRSHPDVVDQFQGTPYAVAWEAGFRWLAVQLEHVAWTGCSFWDLIQPSFMFMVGVSMPFSFAARRTAGQSTLRWLGHAVIRAVVLVVLGVFLQSKGSPLTNFSFVNVLTQIGLGYLFVCLLLGRHLVFKLTSVGLILGGYWYFFYDYSIPATEKEQVTRYLTEVRNSDSAEWSQFTGLPAHWNKHVNAAAAFDREFLNRFPRSEPERNGKRFWVNSGGYQTLNFIPSIVTMIFGLMAGELLRQPREGKRKFHLLVLGGFVCFVVAMALDTTIWPAEVTELTGATWSFCPAVKRIWTPTWTLFSGGWCFWMLAGFYWVIDLKRQRWLAWPLVVVGMNSIVMYCMAQLMQGWVGRMLKIHLSTLDALLKTNSVYYLFGDQFVFAPICRGAAVLFILWLVCWWMYRRKLFVRI